MRKRRSENRKPVHGQSRRGRSPKGPAARSLGRGDALIVVDVQNDFCPGGALPVKGGDRIVPLINRWIEAAQQGSATIVASRDWHPPNHVSFRELGGPWPAHCVRNTPGARFHPVLELPSRSRIVSKGTTPGRDAYSALAAGSLARDLKRSGIQRVWICGLALDYCVRATALDALRTGFEVHLIKDATRAVNQSRGDDQRTLRELSKAGCIIESGPYASRTHSPRHRPGPVHRSVRVDDGAGVRRRAARQERGI